MCFLVLLFTLDGIFWPAYPFYQSGSSSILCVFISHPLNILHSTVASAVSLAHWVQLIWYPRELGVHCKCEYAGENKNNGSKQLI